jgi:phospholipid/cholesterol/gamma-HCH transport system ATP-binding protein
MMTSANNDRPIITLEHVWKAFDEKKILSDFSLDIMPGETMTIIGGSGSGKSVTLKLILGLLDQDRGTVTFKGNCVGQMDEAALRQMRKQIGMLFQGGALFDSLTVRENVAYPLREHFEYSEDQISERVAVCLEHIGLPGIEAMMPSELSGGMRKRVSLARAIATEPAVILYDEPTTGLDPANTNRISLLIKELQQKLHVTSIVVTHDMRSAFMVTDRLALLYNQRIEFVGSVPEAKASTSAIVQNFIHGHLGEEDATKAGLL